MNGMLRAIPVSLGILLLLPATGLALPAVSVSEPSESKGLASPPEELPKGSIVAFLPDMDSGDYSDLAGLKSWLGDRGWAICDGSAGTPDLNFRLLLGTVHPEEAGQNLGSRTHQHRVTGNADAGYGREYQVRSGLGRSLRVPADGHKHKLVSRAEPVEHLPLSLRVLYIIKIR